MTISIEFPTHLDMTSEMQAKARECVITALIFWREKRYGMFSAEERAIVDSMLAESDAELLEAIRYLAAEKDKRRCGSCGSPHMTKDEQCACPCHKESSNA